VLIDSHHQSPITQLFVAYNSSRKQNISIKRTTPNVHHHNIPIQDYERGGHLISVSENGTIAVTNLNSGEIHRQLHNYSINEREKRRAE